MINKILFITLSNIGDVILTLPALDWLKDTFADARITVITGQRPKELFEKNPQLSRLIIYDKHCRLREKIKLFRKLKREKFDLVVDLRNSLFGILLPARYKTQPFLKIPKNITHMADRHLYKTQGAARATQGLRHRAQRRSLYIRSEDEEYIGELLRKNNILQDDNLIVVSPGARSEVKRWPKENFLELCRKLVMDKKIKIILVGDSQDARISSEIAVGCGEAILNLCAKTSMAELAALLKRAKLLITNDSAVLHLGSYLNIAVVALFGPTDEKKYGPWSEIGAIIKKERFCRPCQKAQCPLGSRECLSLIRAEEVLQQVRNILLYRKLNIRHSDTTHRGIIVGNPPTGDSEALDIFDVKGERQGREAPMDKIAPNVVRPILISRLASEPVSQLDPLTRSPAYSLTRSPITDFRRILVVRTDRIGDVLLSTPVIKALRRTFPSAYIAMLVSPYASQIVEGNPSLDEIIIYDKEGREKSWQGSIAFALRLKRRRFDLAVVLHPTLRVHIITFLAAITKRVGYDYKFGFLLTDRIKNNKPLGEKHELEYNLDLLRYLGIETEDKSLFMPIKPESERWVEDLFKGERLKETDRLLAVHPGASCLSKIWPAPRFAEVSDRLIEKRGFKVLLVGGSRDIKIAEAVIKGMRHPAINLAGKTSVSQLASLLKRCNLLISNDSGPVHIAASLGTAVVAIFGRSQPGLSPKRWGPLGAKSRFLHREIGCIECLAHNCLKEFNCLKAISVEDVLKVAEEILS